MKAIYTIITPDATFRNETILNDTLLNVEDAINELLRDFYPATFDVSYRIEDAEEKTVTAGIEKRLQALEKRGEALDGFMADSRKLLDRT